MADLKKKWGVSGTLADLVKDAVKTKDVLANLIEGQEKTHSFCKETNKESGMKNKIFVIRKHFVDMDTKELNKLLDGGWLIREIVQIATDDDVLVILYKEVL